MMNMTNWRSVTALVGDTTAVLDPCSLEAYSQRIPVSPSVKEEDRTKARTLASSLSWMVVIGRGESELYFYTFSCDMQLFIVSMMDGIAERETARKAMRGWREPRAIATTLTFFVALPMRGFCMPPICRDKVRLGTTRRHITQLFTMIQDSGIDYAYLAQAHLPHFLSFL
jgi:hypothetical protein